jgi:hypothetical protein
MADELRAGEGAPDIASKAKRLRMLDDLSKRLMHVVDERGKVPPQGTSKWPPGWTSGIMVMHRGTAVVDADLLRAAISVNQLAAQEMHDLAPTSGPTNVTVAPMNIAQLVKILGGLDVQSAVMAAPDTDILEIEGTE